MRSANNDLQNTKAVPMRSANNALQNTIRIAGQYWRTYTLLFSTLGFMISQGARQLDTMTFLGLWECDFMIFWGTCPLDNDPWASENLNS